jgi:uncharacterized protein YjbI with pentapeptide repeats
MEEAPNYQPPMSVEELLQRYASGERYFARFELPDGANLSGVNLEGSSLEHAMLFDVDFSRSNLRGVSFCEGNIKCGDFRGADLEGAKFEGAAVESIMLDRANLNGVTFRGATCYGYTLKDGQRRSFTVAKSNKRLQRTR